MYVGIHISLKVFDIVTIHSVYFHLYVPIVAVPTDQTVTAPRFTNAAMAGALVGGLVAGVVATLLAVGIIYGCWKLAGRKNTSTGAEMKCEEKLDLCYVTMGHKTV